jgi:hypothetical protein
VKVTCPQKPTVGSGVSFSHHRIGSAQGVSLEDLASIFHSTREGPQAQGVLGTCK